MKGIGAEDPVDGKAFSYCLRRRGEGRGKNIEKSDVSIDDVARTVTVKVFQAEILSNEIEPSSVTVYDQSFNPLNQVKVENYAEFLDSEKSELRRRLSRMVCSSRHSSV